MTKWSNPECETRILIKLLLSMTYIFIVFLMWVTPLVHDAIQLRDWGSTNAAATGLNILERYIYNRPAVSILLLICIKYTNYFVLCLSLWSDHWSDLGNRCALGLYEKEECVGHTQVNLSGLSELAREEGRRILIAHNYGDIKMFAGTRQLDWWRWYFTYPLFSWMKSICIWGSTVNTSC